MKINQLLMQKTGQKIGGFTLSIKTYKKNWQSGKFWWQQVICMDETGEIPVDVKTGLVYNPIRGRAQAIHITVAEVQEAEYLGKDRKKLVVDQFTIPTITFDEGQELEAENWARLKEEEIRGKVRHGVVCSLIRAKEIALEPITDSSKKLIEDIVNYISTGE